MIGLTVLGIYCFFAAIFGSYFAKAHFYFSFFNFPIFIGEMVLLLCLGIFVWTVCTQKVRLTKLQCLFGGYLGCIVLWALYDYFKVDGGPLALRNAVLFFYPIFGFFAYYFYDHSLFSKRSVQALLALLLLLSCFVSQVSFFSFIYFLLFFVILYTELTTSWKYVLWVAAFIFWPYNLIFSGARTCLVASVLTGLFLIFLFIKYFLTVKTGWKLLTGSIVGVIFLCGAFHFADKGGLKTLTSPMEIIKRYKEVELLIAQQEPSFRSEDLQVHLYNAQENDHLVALPKILSKQEGGQTTKPAQNSQGQKFYQQGIFSKPSGNFQRDIGGEYNDIFFRVLIWQDMIRELWESKSILGVGLAHPERSRNIEILNWAWGEWSSEGWIAPHNSFLHLIYRAGVFGIGMIVVIFIILYGLIKDFIAKRSVRGVLLCGIIIYGLIAANFLMILELPYYAIPFWTIFGLTMAYRRDLLEDKRWAASQKNI